MANMKYNPKTGYYEEEQQQVKGTYGDVNGASSATKYQGQGVAGSNDYVYNSSLNTSQLSSSNYAYGKNAELQEQSSPGYLENRNNVLANALYNEGKTDYDSVNNYLLGSDDFKNYNKSGQDNTVNAILNRMGSMQEQANAQNNQNLTDTSKGYNNTNLMNSIIDNSNKAKDGASSLMGGGANYGDYWTTVENTLKSAYGINSLEEFKQKYPEQYESTLKALQNVEGVWNATDQNQRQLLDGQLQGIIGTGVGAGADTSKIKVLESSILSKFENPDQVQKDAQDVNRLQTQGKTTQQIADEMGISKDQVEQLILLNNGLVSKAGKYYQLTEEASKDVTDPYDTQMERARIEKDIAIERANRQLEWLTEDFNTAIERQKKTNEVNAHNADFLAGQYGYGFSKRGIEGLNYVAEQAQQIIDDITKNYDRNSQEIADQISDILRQWERANEDLEKASEDALTQAKNNYTSQMLSIQQQYGTVGLQAQQYLSQNVQSFITTAENIYDNALTRQQNNLTNLINNVSNLNAVAAQNLTLRQSKIEQFKSEAMTMNRSQLQQLANQLGMSQQEYGDLVDYQAQAVANQLNGYAPGSGIMYQDEISTMLEQGANPQEVMQWIMNQDDFKSMASSGGDGTWVSGGDGIIFNNKTAEIKNLGGTNSSNSTTTVNSNGGVTVTTVDGKQVSTTDANGNYQRVKLGETATDTGIKNVYGSNVKLAPTVGNMLQTAVDTLKDKGIDLQVGDSYRSYETQKKAYEEDQAKPASQRKGVAAPGKSYHELGQAIDIAQNQMNDPEVVQALLDAGFTRPVSSEKRHWSFGEGKDQFGGVANTTTSQSNGMDEYDLDTATMRIGKMAYGKSISNDESTRVQRTIKNGMAKGKTMTQILYDVSGLTINKNEDKAQPLIDILVMNSDEDGLAGYNVGGFSEFINNSNFKGAVNFVEQAVANKQGIGKDMKENEASAVASYNKGNEAISLIEDNLNSLGIVAGNYNKYKSKFLENENFQKIESKLTSLVADWRHEMAGSAVTETELKMIDALIPSVKDNPYNAITKIQELQDSILNELNSQRSTLNLPSLDQDTLLDKDKRTDLYFGTNVQGRGLSGTGGSMTKAKKLSI